MQVCEIVRYQSVTVLELYVCWPYDGSYEYVNMGDSLSDRLISDLIEGCQDFCEEIGCLPNLLR